MRSVFGRFVPVKNEVLDGKLAKRSSPGFVTAPSDGPASVTAESKTVWYSSKCPPVLTSSRTQRITPVSTATTYRNVFQMSAVLVGYSNVSRRYDDSGSTGMARQPFSSISHETTPLFGLKAEIFAFRLPRFEPGNTDRAGDLNK